MTLRAKVTHGLKWQAIMTGGRQLLSLAVFAILARLLDPADFGLMGLTYIYLMFAGMITDPGIGTALVQRADPEPAHWDAAFWFNVGCALFLCIATILLAGPIAALCEEPKFTAVLRWSSIGLVLSSASFVHATRCTKEMDFGRLAIRNLSSQLIAGVIGVSMAFAGYGVWALVGQQLSGALLGTIFLWIANPYRPALRFSWPHFRDLSQVSAGVFFTNLLSLIGSRADQLILGRFAGTSALGLYIVAGKIPEIIKMTTQQPLFDVLVPAMSKLQGDKKRMTKAIYRGMELNAAIVFPIYVGVTVVSADLLAIFGPKWVEASLLCSLFSIYALLGALHVYNYPALLATGLTGKFFVLNGCSIAGMVTACVVGIQFGVNYVVGGLILNSLIFLIPFLRLLRVRVGLEAGSYYKPCVVPAGAALAMTIILQVAKYALTGGFPLWLRLATHVALGASVYLGLMYVFSPATLMTLSNILKQALPGRQPAASALAG
jgi:O-antigen/teichoic acid export membrane protein